MHLRFEHHAYFESTNIWQVETPKKESYQDTCNYHSLELFAPFAKRDEREKRNLRNIIRKLQVQQSAANSIRIAFWCREHRCAKYWQHNHHDHHGHSDFRSLRLFWSCRSPHMNENLKRGSAMNRSLRTAFCPRNRLFNYAPLCFTGRKRNYILEKITKFENR